MSSVVQKLTKKGLIHPPRFIPSGMVLEVVMGSVAYACNDKDSSDMDIYGVTMPPKHFLFPHLAGEITGFNKTERFETWQAHHIDDKETNKQYDFQVYNISRFFQLAMENNPNMVDALFVPRRCVLYSSPVGEKIRENRHLFLHKGCYHKFRGYSFAQLHRMNGSPTGKRKELVERHGMDSKFAYHIVRLMLQAEQILTEHTLDLERNRGILKSIRRGEWTKERIISFFEEKEKSLEVIYNDPNNTLPYRPDEDKIKNLLVECIEMHYGSLGNNYIKIKGESEFLEELLSNIEKRNRAIQGGNE